MTIPTSYTAADIASLEQALLMINVTKQAIVVTIGSRNTEITYQPLDSKSIKDTIAFVTERVESAGSINGSRVYAKHVPGGTSS